MIQKLTNNNNFSRFPLYQSFILNIILVNYSFIQMDKFTFFEINKIAIILIFVNLLFSYLIYKKFVMISNSPLFYVFNFAIFQFLNINKISDKYFWNTIPDSNSYRLLGESFWNCGMLALDCNSESFLQWPLGQPMISGFLSIFFYQYAKYIYVLLFSFSIYLLLQLAYKNFGNYYHFGAFYFFLLPNNYELSSFIISEIPYIFFTAVGLFFLKNKKNNIALLIFIISFLIRPIGVVNLIGYFIYLLIKKEKKQIIKSLLVAILVLNLIATYNYSLNGKFIISETVSTNIANDAVEKNMNLKNFIFNLSNDENQLFITQNLQRLYGAGSRDCVFEYCVIYNPLFTEDGTVPDLIPKNNVAGYTVNIFLSELFKIGSPLGVWVYLPFTYIFLLRKKNSFDNLILFLFLSNIFLSILTAEYGSRWWLLPNLLSIYLLSNLIYKIKH